MRRTSRIFVAGHTGLVGSALIRALKQKGYTNLLTRTRAELDLTRQEEVEAFFRQERPEFVFVAAAKVGGILANRDFPGPFIRDNLLIQTFLLDAALRYGSRKVLMLGSSCIYPKHAPQPMQESCLLSGALEPTNAPYAVAKIAGLTMAEAYARQYGLSSVSLMPTNLYGPGDNFDPQSSHVIPGLMRRMHVAKLRGDEEFVVWGSGEPRREFLHVDDLAEACLSTMRVYEGGELLNVGTGEDIRIRDLAELLAEVTGYRGQLVFDASKPDGTPRKLLDVSRIKALGWAPRRELREGLQETYAWFLRYAAAASCAA